MRLQGDAGRLGPALQSIQGVRGICVEANLGIRGKLMNDVDQLLKKNEVARDGPDGPHQSRCIQIDFFGVLK